MRTKPPQMRPVSGAHPAPAEQAAEHGGDQQRRERDQRELAVEDAHAAILDEVLGVLVGAGLAVRAPEPGGVRVPEALQRAHGAAVLADVRGVRVALLVGVRVVLAVIRDPVDDRALHGEHPEIREDVLGRLVRLEGTMGQHPVEADRDADPAEEVHQHEDGDVGPAEPATPQKRDRSGGHGEGDEDCSHVHTALKRRHGMEATHSPLDLLKGRPRIMRRNFVLKPQKDVRTGCLAQSASVS